MDIQELSIGLIGGTGEEGRGLALRWAIAGAQVSIGSRTLDRAKTTADELNQILNGRALQPAPQPIGYGENRDVIARSESVLLTVQFAHAASTLEAHRGDFRQGSILIDITVPVSLSASEHLKTLLPENVPLVAAFKTEPAHLLAEIDEPLDCDSFVAGDSKEAKAHVMEAIGLSPACEPSMPERSTVRARLNG
ncbi:MAG: NADPH-dependent F420 reductase [Acidobacteria bacterium]|nr:MAG: NADPH-dependent F420 reductase [Acidobacteriota bacterium]